MSNTMPPQPSPLHDTVDTEAGRSISPRRNASVVPAAAAPKTSEKLTRGGSVKVLPTFKFSELVLGRKVGSGGFCVVQDIVEIRLQSSSQQTTEANEFDQVVQSLRNQLAATCVDRNRRNSVSSGSTASTTNTFVTNIAQWISPPPPSPPTSRLSYNYVIKLLRRDLPDEEVHKGRNDMAIESNYLQALSHPHIISLKGLPDPDHHNLTFLILEKLTCTLEVRLKEWRRDVGRAKLGFGCFPFGLLCPDHARLHALWLERFSTVRDIALAMEYLHSHRIVYRDLKPENIGFDYAENKVKLFDFGLAKTLPPRERSSSMGDYSASSAGNSSSAGGIYDSETGMYNLTGNTGSLRYMAPEVALNQPYDERVDTYSFGVLLWQICALSIPYGGYSCKMHADLVVRQGYRPKVYPTWPAHWGQLMRECWAGDVQVRPNFTRIVAILQQQLDDMQGTTFSPTFKHLKAKADKVGSRADQKAMDSDTRFVQMGGDVQVVIPPESEFANPESSVV